MGEDLTIPKVKIFILWQLVAEMSSIVAMVKVIWKLVHKYSGEGHRVTLKGCVFVLGPKVYLDI